MPIAHTAHSWVSTTMSDLLTETTHGKGTRHRDILLSLCMTVISTIGMRPRQNSVLPKSDTNGNTTAVFTATKDGYDNHLNFDFTLDTDGNHIYFAWADGTPHTSTLNIEKYDGTATTQILSITLANSWIRRH